ncbi:PD-(D/E)XK nuclease family protein [Streptomyces sp. NPDC048606]|uniref:PD-(D/E)XK nuclease family protein n=1 Tax=Streptomyces sp. NPDC048606 TaxID=3154726 RepID=UPI00344454C0
MSDSTEFEESAVPIWQKPPGVNGDSALVRVGLPVLRQEDGACPLKWALKARPRVQSATDGWRTSPVVEFSFAAWEVLVDAVEFPDRPQGARGGATVTPAHLAWGREAAAGFLVARERFLRDGESEGLPRTVPVEDRWVAAKPGDVPGVRKYELEVWGRQYATPDGSVRELWLPQLGALTPTRPLSELAAAAGALAHGVPSDTGRYKAERTALHPGGPAPDRVRIVGVGLGDGRISVLRAEEDGVAADWTSREARDMFDRHAAPRVAPATSGTARRPGQDCVDCKALSSCPSVKRVPGLLGVPERSPGRKRRTVSISDLRAYRDCPSRYHLTRVLRLRELKAESEAIRRGRAVDAWLNTRHADPRRVPCRHISLPRSLPGLAAGELAPALAMLERHRARCPFDRIGAQDLCLPQHRVTVYDPEADVVVLADCDLVYTERGAVVVRETKTGARRYGANVELMEYHPQLALAVLFVASGVLTGDPRRSRVELETLRVDGSAEEELDPFDPATVEQARGVVRGLAASWAAAVEYPEVPRTGYDCGQCEARRWCATGRARRTEGAAR